MTRLTREILKSALSANNVAHSSRARVAELLGQYNELPIEVRRAFQAENELEFDGEEEATIEDIDETEGNEGNGDENEENEGSSDGNEGNDGTEVDGNEELSETDLEADAELALLRKQEEILLMRS